ncbi:hypothetical protein ElyMa_001181000 [Elysia marginata]|uniref:Uncharacterized protein n=1 Tax=Elysia marginata TaxID=1093978 RepID=A0AAV4I3L1_9GAST|nr:hypothetical protein ElyMa_001181000 [Elysia marginata]
MQPYVFTDDNTGEHGDSNDDDKGHYDSGGGDDDDDDDVDENGEDDDDHHHNHDDDVYAINTTNISNKESDDFKASRRFDFSPRC